MAANAFLFTLANASDSTARLWPALFGALLALTPFLFRRHIGRVGALAAGAYLALSPAALCASRQLDGTVVAAVGAMAFLGGLARFFDTQRTPWLFCSAICLALAVTSSPAAYGVLVAAGLAWLLVAWFRPSGWAQRLGLLRPHLAPALATFLLAGLALATGLGWNPAGMGAAGDLLGAWLARLGMADVRHARDAAVILALYEPLALLSGLGGLVWAVRRGSRFGAWAAAWVGLGGMLLALMPGRVALDVTGVLLPLVLLGGLATEALVSSKTWQPWRPMAARVPSQEWLGDGLYALVVLVLWGHLYLMLAHYAVYGSPADLALVLLTVALQVLLALIFALAIRVESALCAVGVGTSVVLLAATLSAAWGSAYVRPADPRELLAGEPTAPEVRDLVETLRDLSWQRTGMPTTLAFTVEAAPDSVLAWYLRDFGAAHQVESLDMMEGDAGDVVVSARSELPLEGGTPPAAADGAEYVGQDLALRRRWSLAQAACTWSWPPQCSETVKWLLFRRTGTPPEVDRWAVLWLRKDSVADPSHSH